MDAMNDKDNYDVEAKAEQKSEPAMRARNRTVMLTPDIAGQVRAKLAQGGTSMPRPPETRDGDVAATISPQSVAPGQGFYSQMVQPVVTDSGPRLVQQARPVVDQVAPSKTVDNTPTPGSSVRGTHRQTQPDQSLNDLVFWTVQTPLVGFMVSYDYNPMGEVCSLRAGRLTVTSVPQSSGSSLLIEDPSISPNHAIIRVSASGEIQVLDQLSESGTHIKRFGSEDEIELSGDKSFLEHGDTIRFGTRTFHVSIIIRGEMEA
jgi:hypothetical protein